MMCGVLLLCRYGQSDEEVEKYMERISSNDEKYEVYVQLAMWRRAAEVANKMKDLHKLQQVLLPFLRLLPTLFCSHSHCHSLSGKR
jgi:hypothetical protein